MSRSEDEAVPDRDDEEKGGAEAEQEPAARRGSGLSRMLFDASEAGSEDKKKRAAETRRMPALAQPEAMPGPDDEAEPGAEAEQKPAVRRGTGLGRLLLDGFQPGLESEVKPAAETERTSAPEQPQEAEAPEEAVSDAAATATISPEEREATEPTEPVEAQTGANGEETALLAAQEDQAGVEKLTAWERRKKSWYPDAQEDHAGIEELTAKARERCEAIAEMVASGRCQQALGQLDSIGEEYAETEYHAKFESLRNDATRRMEEAKRTADEEAERQRLRDLTAEAKEHCAAISAQIEGGQHDQALQELNFLGSRYAATEYHAELEALKRTAIDRAEEQKRLAAERAEQEKELSEFDEPAQGAREAVVPPSVRNAPSPAYSKPAPSFAPPRPQRPKISAGRRRGSPTRPLATAPRRRAGFASPGSTPVEGAIPAGRPVSRIDAFVGALLRRPPMQLIIGGAVAAVIIVGVPVFAVVMLGSGGSQTSGPAPFSTPAPHRSKPEAARAPVEGLRASKETKDAALVPAASPAETSDLPGSAEDQVGAKEEKTARRESAQKEPAPSGEQLAAEKEISAEPIGEAEGAAHSRAPREETLDARTVPEGEPAERKATGLVEHARDELGPEEEITNSIAMQFVLMPAGEFTAGSEKGDADERPVHKAFLDAYYIGRYEVTNAQYQHFNATHRDKWKEYSPGDDMPVVCVTWEEATSFCRWLSRKEGIEYRLPTEAEWEKAARGTDARIYPWGNEAPDAGGACRCNMGGRETAVWKLDGHEFVSPVGSFPEGASPSGCFDMAGNVWEWCLDRYATDYSSTAERNPPGPTTGAKRVMRGGSFTNGCAVLRCSNRRAAAPSFYEGNVGFRCLRAVKEQEIPQPGRSVDEGGVAGSRVE